MTDKVHLLGMTLDELKQVVQECGLPKFAAKQLADWLYKKKVKTIDEMSNISLANRALLSEKYDIGRTDPVEFQRSVDGTVKYLFKTDNGKFIVSVMIPDDDRATLCVSSQVGCRMNCLFCMTGKQGLAGHLKSHDIINQLFSVDESDDLTNVVFMGMGEPLDNYGQLKNALEIMTSEYGF